MTLFAIPVTGNYKITEGWIPGLHNSVDFAVPVGTIVTAAAPGTVVAEGNDGAMGDTIQIQHANGYRSLYGNLTTYSVAKGDTVTTGQPIGTSGGARGSKDPGDSTGPHLPFQVWHNGIPVNPAPLLGVTVGSTGTNAQTASTITSTGGTPQWFNLFGIPSPPPNFLPRMGLIITGGVFLLIALIRLAAESDIGKAAVSQGKGVVKDAAIAAVAIPK